ncbi:uncharacterized protein LOC124690489 [Lolium rigidum]|uniref:uncharacterized protein LOC124690489 n=1 Tax=Lolium rigidum TaxID=89674 RepID=UPI001F5C911C|nr:uncharacterized protein LOC124690489 [Lolium rigidum]
MYYFKKIYIGELIGVETNISESKNRSSFVYCSGGGGGGGSGGGLGPWPPRGCAQVEERHNLLKDTIQLVPDPEDPDRRLVSFTFEAVTDNSLLKEYFAKEKSAVFLQCILTYRHQQRSLSVS